MGSLDGPKGVAQFCAPLALAVLPATPDRPFRLLVTEAGSAAVRWVDEQGNVGTLAGARDPACARHRTVRRSPFISPWGLAAAADGTVYLADPGMRAVFRIDPVGVVSRVIDSRQVPGAGDFRHLALDPERGILFVSDDRGIVRVALDGKEPPRYQNPRRAGAGLIRGLVLHRGLLYIVEETGAIRVQDPECGCERLLTVPRALRLDHASIASSASQPRFGPLRGDPPAFPGIALCLAFNDRGIGLVGSPDCLAELYLDATQLGEGCPAWDTPPAAAQGPL
jgi:hypothetical protein